MGTTQTKEQKVDAKKILIVDDHPVLRRGLALLINHEPDLEVCAEAEDVEEAIASLEKDSPDVVLVDIALKGVSGMELVRHIRAKHPRVPALVVSAHDETRYAERSIRAGAAGYVMKEEHIDVVVAAIRKVLRGDIYLSDRMMPKLMSRLVQRRGDIDHSPYDLLSDRELEVFQLIGGGMRTREIADKLGLSAKTVQVYRDHIKKKLHLKDSVELHQTAFDCVHNESFQ